MSLSHGRVPAIRMWRVHRSHRPSSKENSQSKAKQIGIAPHELISVRELGWSLPENGAVAHFLETAPRRRTVLVPPRTPDLSLRDDGEPGKR